MKKNIIVILYCIALILISELPTLLKPFLVHSTGTIMIIGYQMGIIIAVSLLFKWKITKLVLYIALIPAIIFDLSDLIFTGKYLYLLFLFLHLLLLLFFIYSKSIRDYLQKEVVISSSFE
ncbi:MAG: hypothetical protein WC209_15950 [Ignavibacteriaceae bacterium]|jgi:hypothetical protein